MIGLTSKQAELLWFIKRYMRDSDGIAPSFQEMQAHVGLKSKSGIHACLNLLEERGHIRRLRYRARSIELLDGQRLPDPLDRFTTDQLIAEIARRQHNGQ